MKDQEEGELRMTPKSGWEPGNWNAGMLRIWRWGEAGGSHWAKEGQGKKIYQGGAKLKGNRSLCLEQRTPLLLPPTHQDLGGKRSPEKAVQGLWDEV